jgi:hypothetical protein
VKVLEESGRMAEWHNVRMADLLAQDGICKEWHIG